MRVFTPFDVFRLSRIAGAIGAAWVPPATAMSFGVNLGGVNTYIGAYPFVNLAYTAAGWEQYVGTGAYTQNCGELSAATGTDEFQAYLSDTGYGLPAGTYRVLNPDACEIGLGVFNSTNYTGGYTTDTDFTFEYPGETFLGLQCKGSLTKVNGNLVILMPGTHAQWVAGDIWNPEFISYWQGLGASNLRFMDWNCANTTSEVDWVDATPADAISFFNTVARGCSPPVNVVCSLADRLDANPWACVPPRASVDYVTQMAASYATHLTTGRKLWLEYANEIWNFGDPFSDNTHWLNYLDHTKRTATANFGTNTYTLAGHGLVHGQTIMVFRSRENNQAQALVDGSSYNGSILYVEVTDANTFKIHLTSVGGATVPVVARQVNLLFLDPNEVGKTPNTNEHYAELCLRNWDLFDVGLGTSRVVHICSSQSANPGITEERFAVGAMAARTDYVAIAPYMYGTWLHSGVDIASGSLTPKVWANTDITVHVAVYASGATPRTDEIIAGTGAINKQEISYALAADYQAGVAVTGLVNGTDYEVFLVFVDGDYTYQLTDTLSPSAVTGTTWVADSFANQSIRNRLAIPIGVTQVAEHASNGKPVVCYEGGAHFHESSPAAATTWIASYMESADFATALRRDHYMLAAANVKLFDFFTGAPMATHSSWKAADSFSDTSDVRYVELASYSGSVTKHVAVDLEDVLADDIASEPGAFPVGLHTFADPALTYTILAGNDAENFAVSSGVLNMTAQNGVDWDTPALQDVVIMGSDGFTEGIFSVLFNSGDAWYAADAAFAWVGSSDADNAAINPDKGNTVPLTAGTGATITDGLWDMEAASEYSASNGLLAAVPNTAPVFAAWAADRDDHVDTYRTLAQFGSGQLMALYTQGDTLNTVFIRWRNGPGTTDTALPIPWDAGLAVYWMLIDPINSLYYIGKNQTIINTGGTAFTSSEFDGISSYVLVPAESQAKLGAMQILSRGGLTVADAQSLVQKMQSKLGIA